VRVESENLTPSGILLKFAVSDTGIGIPDDKMTSIFEAFSQADTSTTRQFGGTGLGLAICDRLVRLLGGSIGVKSEVGKGSEFHFTIKADVASAPPIASEPEEPATSSDSLAALARVGNRNRHILVAEDNPANRIVARMTLEKFGFQVHEAADGAEALEAAKNSRFDVILMDCRMPGMDGYEAARRIRTIAGDAGKVPIIALTASAFKEDRMKAEQAGMNDFIAKPFQDDELLAKCVSWSSSSREVPAVTVAEDVNGKESQPSSSGRLDKYPADFLRNIMQIFLETAPTAFERLVSSIESYDWEQARSSAHWLRGGATRVIAPELQEQLTKVENVCVAETPEVSNTELLELTNAFASACRSAEKWLAEDRTVAHVES
jgi:two-component system, sensor histidine kinase and response regulator